MCYCDRHRSPCVGRFFHRHHAGRLPGHRLRTGPFCSPGGAAVARPPPSSSQASTQTPTGTHISIHHTRITLSGAVRSAASLAPEISPTRQREFQKLSRRGSDVGSFREAKPAIGKGRKGMCFMTDGNKLRVVLEPERIWGCCSDSSRS